LGFAETYNCAQALLGTITVPPASAVISDADPDEHKLLQGRRANTTAMFLLRISLTDDIRLTKTTQAEHQIYLNVVQEKFG
jgi:hypothetical protein